MVGWPGRRSRCTSLHRLVYVHHHGITLEDIAGQVIRHTCDNPRCVNPAHLLLGSKANNNKDRAERGRSAKRVPSRQRLSTDDCSRIRARYDPAKTHGNKAANGVMQLARDYDVDPNVIYSVLRGTYAH